MLEYSLPLSPSFMFELQYNFISLCDSLALSKSVEFSLRSFLSPDQATILRARPNTLIRLLRFGIPYHKKALHRTNRYI